MQNRIMILKEFIMTPVFDKQWSDLDLSDNELRQLQNSLLKNPSIGKIMQGTGGARKMRFALNYSGKSSGIRVIYIDIAHLQKIYLLLCYPKSKKDDLTQDEKKQLKLLISILKGG